MDVRDIEVSLQNRLGHLVNYTGIFSSDSLPYYQYSIKPILFIANTLKSTESVNTVGHWVAFYIEYAPTQRIIFFDSFGISPTVYITTRFPVYVRRYRGFLIQHFGSQFQPDNSVKCGLYVCMFAHYTSHFGIKEFRNFIHRSFTVNSKRLHSNDSVVVKYYVKYMSRYRNCSIWKGRKRSALTYRECLSLIGMHNSLLLFSQLCLYYKY